MTTTAHVTVSSTEWTELADGSENVTVQVVTSGHIEVAVAEEAPTATKDVGIILNHKDTVSFAGLAATDLVYARSFSLGRADTVAVVKS
jgi:ApbE superfamily uncharacterized protein (UPF0280 family)